LNTVADKTTSGTPPESAAPGKSTVTSPENPVGTANPAGAKTQPTGSKTQPANSGTAQPAAEGVTQLKSTADNSAEQKQDAGAVRGLMKITPQSQPLETRTGASISNKIPNDDLALTRIYRVGPNDVLDVHLNDSQSEKSTLFTVTPSGLLEYPTF